MPVHILCSISFIVISLLLFNILIILLFMALSYLNPESQFLLSELNQRMAPRFGKLNKALIELVNF